MNEPISKEEYEKIITSAPSDMELPVYVGKHNDELLYLDLVKAKSIAMYGTTGISSVCNTSLFSMLKAREQILRQKYFLCVSCVGGYYSWSFNDIPFAHEYITDPCVAIYDLLHYYNSVKNTLIKLSGMTEDERKYSGYIYSFGEYKEYLAKHPRLYIFEGYCGPLSEDVLNDSGLDFAAVKEAFENAYKFHIYIIIPDCIRGKNELAESIHTSINIERTEQCYLATIIQDGKTLEENVCMSWCSENNVFTGTNVNFLKSSLLFQMSLGSKELYHSNVWAWLIENDHNFVKVFFPDFQQDTFKVLGVSRECRHRDVIIWLQKIGYTDKKEKYYYVIENKIKSLQRKEQLEDYTENLWENTMLQGVITGIENNLGEDQIKLENRSNTKKVVWSFIDYATISKKIMEFARQSASDIIKKHLPQIEEYCNIINAMYGVLYEALAKNRGFVWYWGDNDADDFNEKLHDLRIEDMYIKLQGSRFIHYLDSKKEQLERLCPVGFRLEIGQSFNNGKATLDIRFTNWQDKFHEYLTIGIQIEGNQYRLLVQQNGTHHGKEIFEKFKGCWFDANFNCKHKERTIFGRMTSMKKLFDSYGEGSNDYIFVYQYYNLTKENSRYEMVFEDIKMDLAKAKTIVEQMNF